MLTNVEKLFQNILKPADQSLLEEKGIKMKKQIMGYKRNPHLLYRLDHESICDLFPLLNNDVKHLKKMCDYVLFLAHESKLYIFLIEMKQGKDGKAKQLDAGEAFIRFVIESAERVGLSFGDEKNIIIKKVGVTGNNTKGTTKRRPAACRTLSDSYYPKTTYIACAGGSQVILREWVEAV